MAVQATAGAHCQDPRESEEGAARGFQQRALQWHVVHLRLEGGEQGESTYPLPPPSVLEATRQEHKNTLQ